MFLAGANWFVKNQDGDGGWPSDVVFNPKKKKYPKADEIPPGISFKIPAFHLAFLDFFFSFDGQFMCILYILSKLLLYLFIMPLFILAEFY